MQNGNILKRRSQKLSSFGLVGKCSSVILSKKRQTHRDGGGFYFNSRSEVTPEKRVSSCLCFLFLRLNFGGCCCRRASARWSGPGVRRCACVRFKRSSCRSRKHPSLFSVLSAVNCLLCHCLMKSIYSIGVHACVCTFSLGKRGGATVAQWPKGWQFKPSSILVCPWARHITLHFSQWGWQRLAWQQPLIGVEVWEWMGEWEAIVLCSGLPWMSWKELYYMIASFLRLNVL